MLIHQETKLVSASDSGWSSGDWSGNTDHKLNGILHQIYVESDTATTTFKFKIVDYNSRIVFDSKDYAVNILNRLNLDLPLKDNIYTLQIYDSSTEEQFKIMLGIKED